ncbi:MAG: hypothetical protein EDM74_04720 [Armatimonadetes bacterium]|nr:MAG: hypothetical protein EDM74_04720 [Armatimonadota bacterium]
MYRSSIEVFLDRERAQLVRRFDEESVDEVLAEIHAHLRESADDMAASGLPLRDSEEIALLRFQNPQRPLSIASLIARNCRGDRAWAPPAVLIGFLGAVVLCIWAIVSTPDHPISWTWATVFMLGAAGCYGYAAKRAGDFANLKNVVAAIAFTTALAVLFNPTISKADPHPLSSAGSLAGLLAANTSSTRAASEWLALDASRNDLFGIQDDSDTEAPLESEAAPDSGVLTQEEEWQGNLESRPFGLTNLDRPKFFKRVFLFLPDTARLSLMWLLLVSVVHGAVAWLRLAWRPAAPGVQLIT